MSLGCSSTKDAASSTTDSGKSDGTDDPSTDVDSGTTTDTDAAAASDVVNGCAVDAYLNATADGDTREIVWDLSVASTEAHCMAIKEGQTVTFKGDFASHPLVASGGDSPNPISTKFDAATGKVDFTGAGKDGIYGFVCGNHPSMMGAIYVLP